MWETKPNERIPINTGAGAVEPRMIVSRMLFSALLIVPGMKFSRYLPILSLLGLCGSAVAGGLPSNEKPAVSRGSPISIRTEQFPRPPYSGATYYIYERDGRVVCTKLEVCNKFGDCETSYKSGAYKDEEDVRTGEPYGKTSAVPIPQDKIKKHVCLTKYHLN